MKKKSFLEKYPIVSIIVPILIFAFFFAVRPPFTQDELKSVLQEQWQAYKKDKPNFTGGLAMQILSPRGNYFITSDMQDNITNNSRFRIASISKIFTASGIMLLQERGLLNIDDKITDNIPGTNIPYLPDESNYNLPYKKDITIRMLLMHRAGIFDVANDAIPSNEYTANKPYLNDSYLQYIQKSDPKHTFTFEELIGVNSNNQLSYWAPGTNYHYSNTGYTILGKIIERVSGQSYPDFVTKEFLIPGKMPSSKVVFDGSDQSLPEPFTKGYVWANGQTEEVTISNLSANVAEGSIYSTPIELATWGKKFFSGQAGLSKETVKQMMDGAPRNDELNSTYGLGIVYVPGWGYGHSGAHEGYLSNMIYNPNNQTTYVIYTNMWDLSKGVDSIKTELLTMTDIAAKVLQKMGY